MLPRAADAQAVAHAVRRSAGAFSILPVKGENAARFAEDPRIKLLSFTGSPGVGWGLKSRAGKKKVLLELGGNAAVIVDAARQCAGTDPHPRLRLTADGSREVAVAARTAA